MGTSHRWVLFAAMALVCLAAVSTALAQEQSGESSRKNSLEKGKSALLFQLSSDIRLSAYDGLTLSYKHHTAVNRAFRVGVTLNLNIDKGKDWNQSTGSRKTNANSQRVNMSVVKLWYLQSSGRVGFYYGLGPDAGFDLRTQESNPETSYSYKTTNNTWSAGVGGVIGIEWFAARDLSFTGEYGSSVAYTHWISRSSMRQQGEDWVVQSYVKSDSWELRPDTVRLGVAVYW